MGEPAAFVPSAGQRLGGRYILEERVGSGGVATVWRSHDIALDRSVSIKLLHPSLALNEQAAERFRREARAAAAVSHPNAVALFDQGTQGGAVYLVLEFVDGSSLKEILAAQHTMDAKVAAALGEQVASALGEAHAHGLVHRDIKPANILISSDGVARVTDFGIAKALAADVQALTSPGTVVGTAAYVAPEQIEGGEVTAATDVYSLGLVLFECLTGKHAFQAENPADTAALRLENEPSPPRQLRADVPRALNDIVVRSCQRDPTRRFSDGGEMAVALSRLVRSRPADLTATLMSNTPRERPRPRIQAAPPATDEQDQRSPPPNSRRETTSEATPRPRSVSSIVLAVLAAVALAAGAYFGSRALQDDVGATPGPAPDARLIRVVAASDFDPHGDDLAEHPAEVVLAYDGNNATAWTSQTYRDDPRFGGLKPGAGLWFDLGDSADVAAIELDLAPAGPSLQVFARGRLPDPVDGLLGWGEAVASGASLDASARLDVHAPGRFWLVWLTELPKWDEETFRASIVEIRFVRAQ